MVWMWNDLDKARFSANYPAESIQRLKDWDSKSQVSPLLGFTLDQTNIKAECSQILAVMTEYYGSLGDGTQDIHSVRDELIKKMKDAGIDKVIEETQKQVDAFVGK
jgi:putative aldouronate transport system substrate-binding protein